MQQSFWERKDHRVPIGFGGGHREGRGCMGWKWRQKVDFPGSGKEEEARRMW